MSREIITKIFAASTLLLLLFPGNLFSQEDADSSAITPETKIHSLFSTIGYGNNLVYLGSTISQDQPFGYTALTYGFRDKLYLTYSAVHLAERSPFVAFSTGSVNYNHTFNSWFDLSAGLSAYIVAPSLTDTLFNNFTYGNLTLGFDWRILYTKITAGGLLSDGASAYFQFRNSRYFQTPEFTKMNIWFSFDPYVNLLLGSVTKTETSSGTIISTWPPLKKGNNSQSSTNRVYSVFGILEADMGLPVALNAGRFTFEAEPSWIIPLFDDPAYPGMKGFVFQMSLFCRIF